MPEEYKPENEAGRPAGIPESFIKLNLGQKAAVAALAFFAVFVFGVWAFQLKNSITSPLARQGQDPAALPPAAETVCVHGICGISVEELKAQDTDGDGLSDYDELFTHKTSPYLADTDGDGFSDYDEIMSGNDPNCPAGANCGQTGRMPLADSSGFLDLKPALPEQGAGLEYGPLEGSAVLENIFLGQSDAQALRALLIQSGLDQDLLGQISDDDLMRYYQETLDSMNELLE